MVLENLQLDAPLSFFDLEATGKSIKDDKVVEICIIQIMPSGEQRVLNRRVNPQMPISKEASEIHGIYDEDVADEPSFAQLASEISEYLRGSDLAGYNIINFDLPLLTKEYLSCNLELPYSINTRVVDAMRIFHKMEKRDLAAALKFYCDEEIKDAHQAEVDVKATMNVLHKQVERYGFENKIEFLNAFSRYDNEQESLDFASRFVKNSEGEVIFNFGKNKGQLVKENLGMLQWMIDKDFDLHTKHVAKELLAKYK